MRFQKNSIQNSVFGIYLNWQMPVVRVAGRGRFVSVLHPQTCRLRMALRNKAVQK